MPCTLFSLLMLILFASISYYARSCGFEVLFIALIVLLFFGGKKIPELMKGLGKGVKSFKEGMNGVEDDIDGKDKKGETKE